MHLPDGFINAPVAIGTGVASLGVVTYSLRRQARELGERTVPLLGVTAAFIFAAQMLNFPVAGGTSGHFLGAVLAAVLLGPWASVVVLAVVLVSQAFGMADGGITALGANVFNMAVVGGVGGYLLFALIKRLLPRRPGSYFLALAIASWASVVAASAACAVELALSGTVPLAVALPAMSSVHMIIGLGEALITCTVVAAVLVSRPDLVRTFDLPLSALPRNEREPRALWGPRARTWGFAGGSLVVAVALAVFVSPFASSAPDGLERVAAERGFEHAAAQTPVWTLSPIPDYAVPGLGNGALATALAGLLGTVGLFGLVILLGRAIGRRSNERAPVDGV